MSERDILSLLQDILDAIDSIRAFTKEMTFEDYQWTSALWKRTSAA
jgi:uncharacterized protein with HEPN domain